MKTCHPIAPLLLALSFPASAEWSYVDRSDGYERYIERETILRDGKLARVWEVDDIAVPDKSGVKSLRSSTEYDCEKRQYRVLYLSGHSEHMVQGSVMFAGPVDGEWKPVLVDTLGELSMELACDGDGDSDVDAS